MDEDFSEKIKKERDKNIFQENRITWIVFAIIVIIQLLGMYFFWKETGVITFNPWGSNFWSSGGF